MSGLWCPQQQASCTTPPMRTHPTQTIVNRSVRTLAAHTSTFTPKTTTRLKRHGKIFNFRHGREGSAARLTVGLVRGSNVGGPGAKWRRTRASASQRLPSPSASTQAHPWSVHTGHGSLQVDFTVNMEAWRSFQGAGLLQTARIAHAAVGGLGGSPPTLPLAVL